VALAAGSANECLACHCLGQWALPVGSPFYFRPQEPVLAGRRAAGELDVPIDFHHVESPFLLANFELRAESYLARIVNTGALFALHARFRPRSATLPESQAILAKTNTSRVSSQNMNTTFTHPSSVKIRVYPWPKSPRLASGPARSIEALRTPSP
jgi:hypothetical protein